MNESQLEHALAGLPLGGLQFHPSIGSTNDAALDWAIAGAPDFSLVVADEQTTGRGRGGRKWFTPAGSALALSLILRPTADERARPTLVTGLAALALAEALSTLGLEAQIKWPNDILLDRRKAAGILVETVWLGHQIESMVIGVGLNVLLASVPVQESVLFPATCVEAALGRAPDRPELLRGFLAALAGWRGRLGSAAFLLKWEQALAFRDETVHVLSDEHPAANGRIDGLDPDGSLRIRTERDEVVTIRFGEVHLRPDAG